MMLYCFGAFQLYVEQTMSKYFNYIYFMAKATVQLHILTHLCLLSALCQAESAYFDWPFMPSKGY